LQVPCQTAGQGRIENAARSFCEKRRDNAPQSGLHTQSAEAPGGQFIGVFDAADWAMSCQVWRNLLTWASALILNGVPAEVLPGGYSRASSAPVASLEGEIVKVSSFVRNVARAMPSSRAACERFPRV